MPAKIGVYIIQLQNVPAWSDTVSSDASGRGFHTDAILEIEPQNIFLGSRHKILN